MTANTATSFIAVPDGESMAEFRLGIRMGLSQGLDHFFALGSDVGLFVVEPEEGEMEQLIPATEELRPIQVAFGYGGETLFVMMSDGELRMYDTHDLGPACVRIRLPDHSGRDGFLGPSPHRYSRWRGVRHRLGRWQEYCNSTTMTSKSLISGKWKERQPRLPSWACLAKAKDMKSTDMKSTATKKRMTGTDTANLIPTSGLIRSG